MTCDGRNKPDIVCVEVHSARSAVRHDDGHAPRAGDPELPFRGIGMPVHFTHGAGLEPDESSGDAGADGEVAGVDDTNLAAWSLLGGLHRPHLEGVLLGRLNTAASDCRAIRSQRLRQIRREDVELLLGKLGNVARRQIGVLHEHLRRRVGHELGEQEGVVLGEVPLVEDQQELTTVRPQALNRVGISRREEPQITFADVIDEHGSVRIEHRDARVAVLHEGPFVGRVPVQFAEASRRQAHVDARNILRGREFALRHLMGPATLFHALAGEVEGVPNGTYVPVVCGRRCVGIPVLLE